MTTYSHVFWNWFFARDRPWSWAFAFGGGVSDVIYLPLMLRVLFQDGPGSWGDLALWDAAAAHPLTRALHSFVPAGAALVAARAVGARRVTPFLWGILTHATLDMLTHVEDAYPIFWPLSMYRFPTPVSYYDPAHFGREFFLIEHLALAVAGGLVLLRAACPRRARTGPAAAGGGAPA